MSAAAYRADIMDVVGRYQQTPGGAPPGELVEAIIHVASNGNAAYQEKASRGLAAIDTRGETWRWYQESELARTHGTDPTVLHQPDVAIEILTYDLNRRQELGVAAREAGQPHALADWHMAALGFRGLADNTGLTANGSSRPGLDFFMRYQSYLNANHNNAFARIDALNQGEVFIGQTGDGLQYLTGEPHNPFPELVPDIPNPLGGAMDAVRDLTAKAGQLAMRAGLFLVGALLALAGLWFVLGKPGMSAIGGKS